MHLCRFRFDRDEFRVKLAPSSAWCNRCRAYNLINEAREFIDDPGWNKRAETWINYIDQDRIEG